MFSLFKYAGLNKLDIDDYSDSDNEINIKIQKEDNTEVEHNDAIINDKTEDKHEIEHNDIVIDDNIENKDNDIVIDDNIETEPEIKNNIITNDVAINDNDNVTIEYNTEIKNNEEIVVSSIEKQIKQEVLIGGSTNELLEEVYISFLREFPYIAVSSVK